MTLNLTSGGPACWAERKAMSFTASALTCGAALLPRPHEQAGEAGRFGVGVEPEIGQAVEDPVEADAQLEPGEVHPEALVRPGPERDVMLHGTAEAPFRRIIEAARVAVRGGGRGGAAGDRAGTGRHAGHRHDDPTFAAR